MDSITQALLGGAVGVAVAGKNHPRRAWLYGAVAGTLPDLDVLVDYTSAVDDFTRHRGFSHSWLVQTIVAPALALALARIDHTFSFRRWTALLWLVFVTHSLLDALTVYGTQVFWPLPFAPVMGGSVFIIDPVYSLVLLTFGVWILIRPPARSLRAAGLALAISTTYLGWGLAAQQMITQRVAGELERQGIEHRAINVTAAPFNTLLWRIVVMTPKSYLQGFASVLDATPAIRFAQFPFDESLTDSLEGQPTFERLRWFTHGFLAPERDGDRLVVKDLRMGSEPSYVFRFVLMEANPAGGWEPVVPYRLERPEVPAGFFAALVSRVIDSAADRRMVDIAMASQKQNAPHECGQAQAYQHSC